MLANGDKAKIGSITAGYEHFHDWKRLAESDPGVVDMETLLKGVCSKKNFMDIFENFIIYDNSAVRQIKALAKNHQYLGVNQVITALHDPQRAKGKLGVFWHTQGAGKSYSMVFFTAKVHRKIGGNYTFLICTDRDDLDTQIYKTFAGCGVADNDKATVPLYYDSRGETLGVATNDINERIAEKLEQIEIDDIDVKERLEREQKRDYHIITAEKRLNQIARDFVGHYTTSWETGKAIFACIDKLTCVRMYALIKQYWTQKEEEIEASWKMAAGEEKKYLSDFQEHYEKIIAEYNKKKTATIVRPLLRHC